MALADYRLCDICDGEVFYDVNLNYRFEEDSWTSFDELDKKRGYKLDYLGDWVCICKDCSEKYIVTIMDRED